MLAEEPFALALQPEQNTMQPTMMGTKNRHSLLDLREAIPWIMMFGAIMFAPPIIAPFEWNATWWRDLRD
jgi:hypothetical protein